MTAATMNPNPRTHADFYEGVPMKRLFAWLVDIAVTAVIATVLTGIATILCFVLILPWLLIPLIWAFTGFVYRWMTIASSSSTWGMRFMAIELRDREGLRLDSTTALLHTAGTYISFAVSPLQFISAAAMLISERGQGLSDMVLGTVMLNRAAR